MSEPGARHEQTFRVHSFETDERGRLAPAALCAFLQEAAGRHAHELGVGMGHLREGGLAWMLQRLRVEVAAWPPEQEDIVVATWPTRCSGAAAERSFLVRDASGRDLARAASRWAVVDLQARRPVRLPDAVRQLPLGGEDSRIQEAEVPRIPRGTPLLAEAPFVVRRSDLDVVGHANNTRYLAWALEGVPDEWADEQELAAFDVVFRREGRRGDALRSRVFLLDEGRLGHEVVLASSVDLLAVLETRWRR